MPTVVPVDEFVSEEWYPGFKPDYHHAPWVVDPVDSFNKEDEAQFWYLDFHWPRGLTPMGMVWNEDGYNWGTQLAAETMPLPPGRGITTRMAGTHLYGSAIPVTDPLEIQQRTRRLERFLPGFLESFEDIWAHARDELEETWAHLKDTDLSQLSLSELGDYLVKARRYHKRGFEVHFQIMYPLLANFLGFYGQCVEFGIEPGEIGKFLQGWDTRIMETDRELMRLVRHAREGDLGDVFAEHAAEDVRGALASRGGPASAWLSQFEDFLSYYGWRTEGSCDVALPSWIEDPTPALGMIKTFLQKGEEHDFDAAREAAVKEREDAIENARVQLTKEEQKVFDQGLATCQRANFPWWQDDHNFYIDLKVSLPMRWACQHISERVDADRGDDAIYLFWPELMRITAGEASYRDYRTLVEARRQFFDHWYGRRPEMPKVLGTIPDQVEDPVLIEIFGLNAHSLNLMRNAEEAAQADQLSGIAAVKGIVRGVARVLNDSDELHRLAPGEVLVCESTSPNWTPAFAKIAACVCDGGGTLSHAAIVGREYGVPTVTALGIATKAITDGDEIEVDGTRGTVTVLRKAATAEAGG